jgi:hypothetical protein
MISLICQQIAEADDIPSWIGGDVEEYFPRESLEINETGEIIITLKHGDSKILIISCVLASKLLLTLVLVCVHFQSTAILQRLHSTSVNDTTC